MGWLAISVARQIGMEKDEVEIIQSGSVFDAGDLILQPMNDIVRLYCPRACLKRLHGLPVIGAVILGMEGAGFDGYDIREKMIQSASQISLRTIIYGYYCWEHFSLILGCEFITLLQGVFYV